MPTCAICQKNLYYLTQHLTAVHGMTGSEYRKRFPGLPLCDLKMSKPPVRDTVECPVCTRRMSYITPRHLRLHGMDAQSFALRFPGAPRKTDSVAQACSEKARTHALRQAQDPSFIDALRSGIEKTRSMMELDDGFRTRRVERAVRNSATRFSSHVLDGVRFRSKLEAALAIWLSLHGLTWEYEPRPMLEYTDPSGTVRKYLPDFKVGSVLLEVRPTNRQDELLSLKLRAGRVTMVSEVDLKCWGALRLMNHIRYLEVRDGVRASSMDYWRRYAVSRRIPFAPPGWLLSAGSQGELPSTT